MPMKLETAYKERLMKNKIRLLTSSFFDKEVRWFHIIENDEFAELLAGGELVFNSSMNGASTTTVKRYIKRIATANPAGIVFATEDDKKPNEEIIAFCEKMELPLFWSHWLVPYTDILHDFAEVLLFKQQSESNRKLAVNNALFRPEDEITYKPLFGTDSFFFADKYIVAVAGADKSIDKQEWGRKFETEMKFSLSRNVIINGDGYLIVVFSDYTRAQVESALTTACDRLPGTRFGVSEIETSVQSISNGYHKALTAYSMLDISDKNLLFYEELGLYQILADVSDKSLVSDYAYKVLGPLIEHDKENRTSYLSLLETFFRCECNMSKTADALFFHRNTLKYKMAEIRDIMGYDVTLNENRLKILLSFKILQMNI